MSLYQLAHEKRDDIIHIAAKHGASNVRILGPETENDSEIDFLVDLEPKRSIFDVGRIEMDIEDLLGIGEERRAGERRRQQDAVAVDDVGAARLDLADDVVAGEAGLAGRLDQRHRAEPGAVYDRVCGNRVLRNADARANHRHREASAPDRAAAC